MGSSARFDPEVPGHFRSRLDVIRKHRGVVAPLAAVAFTLAGLAGAALFLLSPSDIERAEGDLQKAQAVAYALESESLRCAAEARQLKTRETKCRELGEARKDTTDLAWLEIQRAQADTLPRLRSANLDRRDSLYHLVAEYLRLLAEAECEILRAKDARDRGTPYKVAPRVRDLLAPMLSAQ